MDDEVVVVVPKKRRKPKKLYQCSTCSYTTNRAYNIQRHLPKHEAKLPKELQHLCPYNGCWFSSLRYDNMTRHIQGLHRSDEIPAKKKAKPKTPKDDAEPVSEPTINTEANPNVEDLACLPQTTTINTEANPNVKDLECLPQTTDDDIEILSCDEELDSNPNEDQSCSPMPQTNDDFIETLSCDEESVSETSAEDQNSPNDDNLPETTYEDFEIFEITKLTDEDQTYPEVNDLCLPMPQDTYDDIEVLSGYEELISEPADELYELASSEYANPTSSENGDKELKTKDDDITTAQPAENLSTSKPNQIEKESKNQQQNKTNSKKRPLKRKVYKCNCCDYSTNRGFNIKRHLIKHSSGNEVLLHVCIISGCKYSTHRLDSLRRHVKSTHPESS